MSGIGAEAFKPCDICKKAIPVKRDPVLLRDTAPRICSPCASDCEAEWRDFVAENESRGK